MNFQKTFQVISNISIFSLIGVGLNLFLVYTFLHLWIYPQMSDVEMLFNLTILMFFEFIMVHSGVFMSLLGRSWKGWLFFTFLYGIFALAFNAMVNGNQILILYGAVVLNRILPNMLNKEKTDKTKEITISGLYAMIYFFLIIAIVFGASRVPQFGLTHEFLEAANYSKVNTVGGELSEMPHAIMCFGALYYIALTLLEVFIITRRVKRVIKNYEKQ
jgi:hypothetical protein